MRFLLDTNVISETIRERPNQNVANWFRGQSSHDMWLSIVTLVELKEGIVSSEDAQKKRHLSHWLETTVMTSFAQHIVALKDDILIDWLQLSRQLARKRITRQAPDLLLASTARIRDFVMATRNTRHFANTGITVYNPWTNETHTMEAP